jgi:hypothetical protein
MGINVRSASNRVGITWSMERIARSFFHFFEGIFPESPWSYRCVRLRMHQPQ